MSRWPWRARPCRFSNFLQSISSRRGRARATYNRAMNAPTYASAVEPIAQTAIHTDSDGTHGVPRTHAELHDPRARWLKLTIWIEDIAAVVVGVVPA